MKRIPSLTVKRLGRSWWILGDKVTGADGWDDYGPVGPYDNKREAEEDKRGLLRFYRDRREEKKNGMSKVQQ